jgi:ABC-2 type transport system ATP-binding protein
LREDLLDMMRREMASTESAIEVSALHKSYGDFDAVRGIAFRVQRGEIYGLLGPNGAGKTSTVEILEGYRKRTSGQVSVLGFDPEERPRELRAHVGIVLQSSGIYNHVKVGEVIAHFAHFYPHPRDVDEVIDLVGLGEKRDVRARHLSGGQRRRLDLALALIGDPELIFLDEPTTGFDPAARRSAWETIRSLRDLGKTVLLTTHYLDEAQELADRVAIIKGGRILAEGSPAELGVGGGSRYRIAYLRGDEAGAGDGTGEGEPTVIETDDPTRVLHELTAAALAQGEQLRSLSVTRPSLEDVYLELTADA